MASAAAQLPPPKKKQQAAPDGLGPVPMQYLYLPYYLGTSVNKVIQVGSGFNDGHKVSGQCMSIVQYPAGYAIAEIRTGWIPGRIESEQAYETCYVMLTGGHGKVLPEGG